MNKEQILNTPSMPAIGPSYAYGPYRFLNREYLIVIYESDPEAIRAALPEPLEPIAEPQVYYEFIKMPDSDRNFGDYTETGIVIPCLFEGQRFATEFPKEGCNVTIDGRRPAGEGTEKERKTLESYGVKSVYFYADMSNPEEVRAMLKEAESAFGKVDILVNNAGIQFTAPTEEFPDEKWEAIIATDLSASFHGIKAVLPGMQQRDFGPTIDVASAHGLVASARSDLYRQNTECWA